MSNHDRWMRALNRREAREEYGVMLAPIPWILLLVWWFG